MKRNESISHDRLLQIVRYDSDTGRFYWREPLCNRFRAGDEAATVSSDGRGYLRVMIDGVRYKAHRLAWFYQHGKWPQHEIDHINGQRDDNRACNLRDVPKSINQQNHRRANKCNSTRLIGAVRHGAGFTASIRTDGKLTYLGKFRTAEEAHAVYVEAKRALHAGCTL